VEDRTHLLGFYAGTRPDDRGRFLREIHRWPDYKLEQTHDYIQWLFPLAERSGFNPEAPILDVKTIREFRSRLELLRNVQTSFRRMLAFYGMECLADIYRTESAKAAPGIPEGTFTFWQAAAHG
jgi:hypothetical protein